MIINSFLVPLLLTIVVECLAAFILGYRGRNFFIVLILVNIITNPLLNYIISVIFLLTPAGSRYAMIPLELAVVFIEWKLLRYAFPKERKPLFTLSVVMNTASYLTGLLTAILFIK